MKTLIKLSVLMLFVGHLGFTVLYLIPVNPLTKYYQKLTQRYMNTFFTQDWKLFSPEPALYTLKLYYSCNSDLHKSTWNDPLENLIKSHQRNRFLFKGKIIYVYHGIYRHLLNKNLEITKFLDCEPKNKKCYKKINLETKKSPEFIRISNFVKALCMVENKIGHREFKIFKIYPVPFSQRGKKGAQPIVSTEFSSGVINGYQTI